MNKYFRGQGENLNESPFNDRQHSWKIKKTINPGIGFKYGGMEIRRIEIIDDFAIIHISTAKFKGEDGLQIGVYDNGDIEIKKGKKDWQDLK